ncbi:hypothetical protein LC612_39330 [Nostoc sp. CHAB 5834]|nr:hypothetical protein [Nostoc sp. CHAB 5834]
MTSSEILARKLIDGTESAVEAESITDFLEGVRQGFRELQSQLGAPEGHEHVLLSLEMALQQSTGAIRQNRVLTLSAWPLLDKPALTGPDGQVSQFLWMFAIPFLVQVSEESMQAPLTLAEEQLDAISLLQELKSTGFINPAGKLNTFPTLLSRENIQRMGPTYLSRAFVEATQGIPRDLDTTRLLFDPAYESSRATVLYFVASVVLDVSERHVFTPGAQWDGAPLGDRLKLMLDTAGWGTQLVQALKPCSMAEVMFKCAQAGQAEIAQLVELSKVHYQTCGVSVDFPQDGVAELRGHTAEGGMLALAPPFFFAEPPSELIALLEKVCVDQGMEFVGAYGPRQPTSQMLH